MRNAPKLLVRDAGRGKQRALLRLFEEHHGPLFRFAWRLAGSTADAEDIVQECFLALLRPSCSFAPGRPSVRTYLFGAVRNQSLKRLKRREQTGVPEHAGNGSPARRNRGGRGLRHPGPSRDPARGAPASALRAIVSGRNSPDHRIGGHRGKSRLQRARATLRGTLAAYAPRAERTL